MNGPVTTRSAYVAPTTVISHGLLTHCAVITVSPLLHELLTVAVNFPAEYPLGSRQEHKSLIIVY